MSCDGGAELIYGPKVEIARHEDLDALAILLGHRGRHIERSFQHIGHDSFRSRWIVDQSTVSAGGLHCRLHGAIQRGDEDRCPEAIPEMMVHFARKSGAPELIGARRV